jgi:hypothetical protein
MVIYINKKRKNFRLLYNKIANDLNLLKTESDSNIYMKYINEKIK